MKARSSGLSDAITLELFTGYENYIPVFDKSHGLEVMIFSKRADPFYSDNFKTISAKFNTETSFALSRLSIEKLAKPYSSCDFNSDHADVNSFESPLYKSIFLRNKTYDQKNCFIDCFEMTR